jgi:hypothetical protein
MADKQFKRTWFFFFFAKSLFATRHMHDLREPERSGVSWTCGTNRRLAEPHRVASAPTVGGGRGK